jgi:hypothetical protein
MHTSPNAARQITFRLPQLLLDAINETTTANNKHLQQTAPHRKLTTRADTIRMALVYGMPVLLRQRARRQNHP